ncbi:tetratricopeptide repeat protein [Streptomyces barringtoniae]|uniref:tetratricopeptide repeat protein n=1 Tax=Streptomyces barringtoniae TaxID=2892029 RepID=UPI001E39F80A|nr:tetratricopeptide repeat protein [Streptomyces barringtoniae]MCC5480492.1 tetratricopeptide repeat protein [Streptomyces barringtoniae]
MTTPDTSPVSDSGVHGNTFNGPTAVLIGGHGAQHIQFVYRWNPAYRIEDFPAAPQPVSVRMLAEQPSRLLRAVHQVVPFAGRRYDLDELTRWRDDPAQKLAIRLVHGPGGQGKTRLAARFVDLSREAGWTVWQAGVNETGADPIATSPPPLTEIGVLLVVDYAERWPTPDLHRLLHEPLLHRIGIPVRILLLARPAGIWWESLETWIGDKLDVPAQAHPLLPLADDPSARAALFRQARNRFADHLGLPSDQADHVGPPLGLDIDEDYAQILTIHIAALAAVDAHLHHDPVPTNPARASAYLLKRERDHWRALHERQPRPLSTTPEAMGRIVLTAILTRPLSRSHGQTALNWIGLADSIAVANTLLDDHRSCYPPPHADPARALTVLEPLYPDRLGEDFIGLITPADPNNPDVPHPVPGAAIDDWPHQAAQRLLLDPKGTGTATPAPWTRDVLTGLIETARRWPHVATGQLYPLLKNYPELALHAGGTALATLAQLTRQDGLDTDGLTVLETIGVHLPTSRHTDLDVGIAAITARLADHRLATTHDAATRARTYQTLSRRQSYVGLCHEALTAGQHALQAWRDLAPTHPERQPGIARSLANLGVLLSDVGQREEALTSTQEAVDVYRRLAADSPAAHEPDLAASLSNLGLRLAEEGRRERALAAELEAVEIRRRLAADNPAAHEPDLAGSLTNLGLRLSGVGRRSEALAVNQEAVDVYRRLSADSPAAYEPDLATSLTNLGSRLWEMGRRREALTVTQEVVDVYRRLVAGNPAAHEPGFTHSLSNLGVLLSEVGRAEEALTAAQEAVDIRRRLVARNPAAHEPELAASLTNLGVLLSHVGRQTEALAISQEAVDVCRRLAAGNPAAHEPELAASLTNLGVSLSEVGRRSEALTISQEAVDVYRQLSADNRAAHEPELATALSNLGNRLCDVGRRSEALTISQEAVDVYRRLSADNRAAHEPDLARTLSIWAGVRFQARQDLSAALRATGEAVEIYRRLATAIPARFFPPLRAVLGLRVDLLVSLGCPREAREVWNWLAANDPDRKNGRLY